MLGGRLPHCGDAPALVRPDGEVVTHAQLALAVARGAAALRAAGLGPGHAVAVAIAEPASFLVAALSAWEAGAAVVPVDARAGEAAGARLIEASGAAAVIAAATLQGELAVTARAGRALDAAVALVLSTSGSSGEPKRVLLSWNGLWSNVAAILAYLPLRAHSRVALLLPLVHGYALVGQALTALQAGAALVLLQGLTFPPVQLEAMQRLGVTALSSVPTQLRLLAGAAAAPLTEVTLVASAGAALDPGLRALLRAAFPRARRFNQYGLTEASPRVAQLSDAEAPFERGSVGRALDGLELWIEGPGGARLPAGQAGAVCVRGPSVMRGYLGDPEGTAAALAGGRLRTGDVGHLDGAGYLWVHGREDGVVQCGGERVGVEEVAAALRRAPGVADASVVALPDLALGARLVGFVVCREGDLGPVRAHLRQQLAPAQRPARLVPLAALPLLPGGKVDLQRLRALAEAP